MEEKTTISRQQHWDKVLSEMEAQGTWVHIVSERSRSEVIAGIESKQPFGTVLSIGEVAQQRLPKLKVGDIVLYREGINLMPKGHDAKPSKDYFAVFQDSILTRAPEGTELPKL